MFYRAEFGRSGSNSTNVYLLRSAGNIEPRIRFSVSLVVTDTDRWTNCDFLLMVQIDYGMCRTVT